MSIRRRGRFLALAIMFCLQAFVWLGGECFAQTFQDRTTQFYAGAGIPGGWPIGYPGGWGDYNNDGFPDFTSNGHVLRNNGGTSFTVASQPIGNTIWGDYNNDGRLDRFSYDNFLLVEQNSSGEFVGYRSKVPLPDGVTTADFLWQGEHYSWGATWSDLNNDGYLDLYVGGFEGPGVYYPDRIFTYNQTSGQFNITWQEASPPLYRPARGVTAADFDRDGDQDIYVSNYRLEPNRLWRNNGTGTMTDVAPSLGVSGGGHTIGSAWGDIDNDGWLDLFVGNFSHPGQESARFLRNPGAGGGAFQLRKAFDGGDWQESYASPTLGDYDNDGDLDLYFTTVYEGDYPRLYRNNGNWSFTNVTNSVGLGGLGPTYQASWADVDNDGDLDLATDSKLFINDSQSNGNHWLKIHLEGDGENVNSSAIGAQVRVYAGDDILTRQVEGGTGQGNQNDLTLHFGLGSHSGPVNVEILWPEGTLETVNNVQIDELFEWTPDCFAPNNVPIAVDDYYSVSMNGWLIVPAAAGVLENDIDTDGDELTTDLLEDGSTMNGDLLLYPSGYFIYTPDTDFVGYDRFIYRVFDGTDYSNYAECYLTIGTPPPLIPGDANMDGIVNNADAAILAANWQMTGEASWADGDFNQDGNVNDTDATILATNWSASENASVPEPGTITLLLCGLASLALHRRCVGPRHLDNRNDGE